MSSFFDFEIGPPSITYKEEEDPRKQGSFYARPNSNKNYYYYHSDGSPHYNPHYASASKKEVVTPGTHYKSPTEQTFIEDEVKANETDSLLNQAKVGGYQVSIVDADSPLLSNLGLTKDDLRRLSEYNKRPINTSMVASDSTPPLTYAENPRPNYHHSGYQQSNSQNAPSYHPAYESSKYPPSPDNYADRQYKPSDRYHPSTEPHSHGGYNEPSAAHHPPPQGSYDAKSYRVVQNNHPQSSNGYAPSYYNPPQSHNSYNSPHPPPPSTPHSHPHHAPHSHPPPSATSYSSPPSSSPYNPQRSSGEPWRQVTQHHSDWDDKTSKRETYQSASYPPHPPPLPYGGPPSNTGSYYKPSYESTSEKIRHYQSPSYVNPEPVSKPSYSSPSPSSPEYSSHKPYYSSSSYSSSSKVPSRAGSVSIAASSHHPAPAKPGITIRFKAKAPGSHGVSVPLGINPLEIVKKLLPSLNPLNNKKVTIGITIENKKEHHSDYHPY